MRLMISRRKSPPNLKTALWDICLFAARPAHQYRRGSLFCDSDFLKKRPKTRPEKMRDFLLRFVLVCSEKIELFEHDEWFKQWVKDCGNGRLGAVHIVRTQFLAFFDPPSQPSHLTEATALRPRARLNLPAAFSSYFTNRSSG